MPVEEANLVRMSGVLCPVCKNAELDTVTLFFGSSLRHSVKAPTASPHLRIAISAVPMREKPFAKLGRR